MPNWCYNRLRVTGPDQDVRRFQVQAVGFGPWTKPEAGELPGVLNFHSLVPVPPNLLACRTEPTAHDWEREHWGCCVGAHQPVLIDEWEGGVLYEFDTPWSPSVRFVETVSRAWPTLVFVLDYEEPGDGYKGLARAQAGTLDDHCIDL